MSLDLKPIQWIWDPVTTGDTYPAINLTDTSADEDLSAVAIEFRLAGSSTAALNLSNGSGITINTATAGAWDFTIDEMTAVSLAAGTYSYDIQTTGSGGTVTTEFKGTWRILPEHSD